MEQAANGLDPSQENRRRQIAGEKSPPRNRRHEYHSRATARIHHFFSKVVGVTQNNADGTWRQMVVGNCQPGEPLRFVADPGNPYDENAIKVMRSNGEQLGYLNKELAEETISKTLEGYMYVVAVASVTEPLHGGWHGCNILIFEAEPSVSAAELDEYAASHVRALISESG